MEEGQEYELDLYDDHAADGTYHGEAIGTFNHLNVFSDTLPYEEELLGIHIVEEDENQEDEDPEYFGERDEDDEGIDEDIYDEDNSTESWMTSKADRSVDDESQCSLESERPFDEEIKDWAGGTAEDNDDHWWVDSFWGSRESQGCSDVTKTEGEMKETTKKKEAKKKKEGK